jgi:hypothetical protein
MKLLLAWLLQCYVNSQLAKLSLTRSLLAPIGFNAQTQQFWHSARACVRAKDGVRSHSHITASKYIYSSDKICVLHGGANANAIIQKSLFGVRARIAWFCVLCFMRVKLIWNKTTPAAAQVEIPAPHSHQTQ